MTSGFLLSLASATRSLGAIFVFLLFAYGMFTFFTTDIQLGLMIIGGCVLAALVLSAVIAMLYWLSQVVSDAPAPKSNRFFGSNDRSKPNRKRARSHMERIPPTLGDL